MNLSTFILLDQRSNHLPPGTETAEVGAVRVLVTVFVCLSPTVMTVEIILTMIDIIIGDTPLKE